MQIGIERSLKRQTFSHNALDLQINKFERFVNNCLLNFVLFNFQVDREWYKYHTSDHSHESSPVITPICFFIKSSINGAIIDSDLKIVKARNATSAFSELF